MGSKAGPCGNIFACGLLAIVMLGVPSTVEARLSFEPNGDPSGVGGGGGADPSPSKPLEAKVESSGKKPTKLEELSTTDNSTQHYSVDAALKLGFPVGAVDAKYSRRIIVKNYIQYKEFEENGVKVWYGIGVRWIVNAKLIDANANTSGIPFVAASAGFKAVEASSTFQVVGLNNPAISKIVGDFQGNLTLDNYADMHMAFSDIIELSSDPKTIVTPLVVGRVVRTSDEDEELTAGVMRTLALSRISEGKSLTDAQSAVSDVGAKEVIKSVYMTITGSDHPSNAPSGSAKARASEILRGLKVK